MQYAWLRHCTFLTGVLLSCIKYDATGTTKFTCCGCARTTSRRKPATYLRQLALKSVFSPKKGMQYRYKKKIVGGGGGERDSVDMEKKKHKLGTYSYGNTAVLPLNLEKSCRQCEREGVSSSSAVRSALDTVHGFVASHSSAKDY